MPKVKKFTADAIAKLKLPDGRGQIDFFENQSPGRSLILTLNKGGGKVWSALFYEKGRPRRKKLGEFPKMSPNDARKAAVNLDADKAAASARAGTFEEVVEQYLDRHVRKAGLRSAAEVERLLRTNVVPSWSTKRFAEIRRRDVVDLLDGVEDKHGVGVADSTLAVLSGLMGWYVKRDDDYSNPLVRGMRRQPAIKRDRWLSDDEIARLWEATDAPGTFAAICRVLLLTGQRRTKVQMMRWTDVDVDTGEWRIAREPREKGTPPAITLPDTALAIIAAQPRFLENDFVFAGRGRAAFNAWSQSKTRLDAKLKFAEPWRLHDLRRTCRKLMTRARVSTEVAELALGHSIKGIQATYDDPAEYRPRIDEALLKVATEVQRILDPGAKVISLR